MRSLGTLLAALAVGVSTTLVVLAIAILPFLNPVFVAFEQGRAEATAWTGWTTEQLRVVTDAVLADLVLGPPAFDVELDGVAVLNEREREHMADVRDVFASFYLAAAVGALVIVAAFLASRAPDARARLWRWLSRTGLVIAIVTVVGGALGVLFFDAAFSVFHQLFFAAGSWTFDSGTERLVQLFPYTFWVETTVAVGIVVVALSLLLAWLGRRRAAAIERRLP